MLKASAATKTEYAGCYAGQRHGACANRSSSAAARPMPQQRKAWHGRLACHSARQGGRGRQGREWPACPLLSACPTHPALPCPTSLILHLQPPFLSLSLLALFLPLPGFISAAMDDILLQSLPSTAMSCLLPSFLHYEGQKCMVSSHKM